jgi:hypothetical protein
VILLVCGSRSLATRPDAEARVHAVLTPRINRRVGDGLLVTGDAPGPDCAGWDLERWGLSGQVQFWDDERYRMDSRVESARPWHPLERNECMVAHVEARYANGAAVLVLGFVDPSSPTHGTDHTLGLARRAGIGVRRYVYATSDPGVA